MKLGPQLAAIFAFSAVFLLGCENKTVESQAFESSIPAEEQDDSSNVTIANETMEKRKVRLEISEMGISDSGRLHLAVRNRTSVPLNLINITWNFYDESGELVLQRGFPKTVITIQPADGSDSTMLRVGEMRGFQSLSLADGNCPEADVKIYVRRSDYESLRLHSDIECNETKIRQIFQSPRFAIKRLSGIDNRSIPNEDDQKDTIKNRIVEGISPEERQKLEAIYNSAPARQKAIDVALSEGREFTPVRETSDAIKIEALLQDQGWNGHTVTEGIRQLSEGGFLYKLEVIVDNIDYYVVLKTDGLISSGSVILKSEGSPW